MTQTVGFDFVDRRVMAAVQRVASNDPNPADPFRGLYISDETALQLTRGESASGADDRLAAVCAALGLDLLDAAVLATCAAPELNPRFGRPADRPRAGPRGPAARRALGRPAHRLQPRRRAGDRGGRGRERADLAD